MEANSEAEHRNELIRLEATATRVEAIATGANSQVQVLMEGVRHHLCPMPNIYTANAVVTLPEVVSGLLHPAVMEECCC